MVAGVNIRGKQTTYVVDVASNYACVFHFAEGALHSCENRQFRGGSTFIGVATVAHLIRVGVHTS